jgi:hypothetical protein
LVARSIKIWVFYGYTVTRKVVGVFGISCALHMSCGCCAGLSCPGLGSSPRWDNRCPGSAIPYMLSWNKELGLTWATGMFLQIACRCTATEWLGNSDQGLTNIYVRLHEVPPGTILQQIANRMSQRTRNVTCCLRLHVLPGSGCLPVLGAPAC